MNRLYLDVFESFNPLFTRYMQTLQISCPHSLYSVVVRAFKMHRLVTLCPIPIELLKKDIMVVYLT